MNAHFTVSCTRRRRGGDLKIKASITGATGMVGEGVLHECLAHPAVESVLALHRRRCGVEHPKLKELLHRDFSDISGIEKELTNYNAAFLCMGVSSVGMSEAAYRRITFEYTMAIANTLSRLNPDMAVCYVSGAGTDSSEKGSIM